MASEIVTEEMVELAEKAARDYGSRMTPGSHMKSALLAVAPLIRRAALEAAAGLHDAEVARAERDAPLMRTFDDRARMNDIALRHRVFAAAIRALAKEPGQ
ncbi:MAG: hypothetical protein WC869_11780 [Phycisphaerae bacterium]|jgi:hypothetical protein